MRHSQCKLKLLPFQEIVLRNWYGIEKFQVDHVQILYIFNLRLKNKFCIKILSILPDFHEKTLSRSGDIKIFLSREEDVHAHPFPIYGRTVK